MIMPSRVTSNEVPMHSEQGMPSSISIQPTRSDVTAVDNSISAETNVNEQMLKIIDDVYSPVLKLMKYFGIYSEQTNLKHLAYASGRCRKLVYLTRIYCVVVVSGFWLNFIMSFAGVFLGNNIYLFITVSLWCLLIALSVTISLIVQWVPLGDSKKSRFENFFRNLIAINSNVNLEKVKSKSKKGIVIFCSFFVCGAIGTLTTYLMLDFSIAALKPWDGWFGIRIISLIFFIYGMGVCLLTILFSILRV